jgi:hypothetical protein
MQTPQFFIDKALEYKEGLELFKQSPIHLSEYEILDDLLLKSKLLVSEFDNGKHFLIEMEHTDKMGKTDPITLSRKYVQLLDLFIDHIQDFRIGKKQEKTLF